MGSTRLAARRARPRASTACWSPTCRPRRRTTGSRPRARRGLDTIFLAAPTSPDERLRRVAAASRGFLYAVSRTGVTGERDALSGDAAAPGAADPGADRRCRSRSASASRRRSTSRPAAAVADARGRGQRARALPGGAPGRRRGGTGAMAQERDVRRAEARAASTTTIEDWRRRIDAHRRASSCACSTAASACARGDRADQAARWALPVYSPEREAEVLERVMRGNPGPARPGRRCGGCSSGSSTRARRLERLAADDGADGHERGRRVGCHGRRDGGRRRREEQIEKVIAPLVEVGLDVHRSTGVEPHRARRRRRPRRSVDPRADRAARRACTRWSGSPSPTSWRAARSSPTDTVVDVGDVPVGGDEVIVMAGPCSVESERAGRAPWPRAVARGGRARPARRRLQAAHLALQLPGARRGGAALDARGRRRARPGRDHRGHGRRARSR